MLILAREGRQEVSLLQQVNKTEEDVNFSQSHLASQQAPNSHSKTLATRRFLHSLRLGLRVPQPFLIHSPWMKIREIITTNSTNTKHQTFFYTLYTYEAEAQRCETICPRSHSWEVVMLGFEPGSLAPESTVFITIPFLLQEEGDYFHCCDHVRKKPVLDSD